MQKAIIFILASYISCNLFSQNNINIFLKADSLSSSDNMEEAELHLIKLINQNPYNADYYYSLGEIYYSKKDFMFAISRFKKAQDLGFFYRSNYYIAASYMGIQKYDSALFYLEKHIVTPMNGDHPYEKDLATDSVFQDLHDFPGFEEILPPEIKDSSDEVNNWKTDIDYLSKMLRKTHYDPFIKLNEQEWDQSIEQLKNDIPDLNNEQILVGINQFIAKLGDGHTKVIPWASRKTISKELPLVTKVFSDGCYIMGASDAYSELLGAKILKVNNIDFDSVYNAVSTTLSVDNIMGYKLQFDWYFRSMSILYGLGLSN